MEAISVETIDRSPEIITEMMLARGYDIVESEEDKMLAQNSDGHQILILFVDESNLNINTVKALDSILTENGLDHAILVYNKNITASAKKIIETVSHFTIETFQKAELQFNITTHRLVPKHERVSPEENEKMKEKWGTKLPGILSTDPVSRFYHFKKGEIIKVTRKDGFVAYRIVR